MEWGGEVERWGEFVDDIILVSTRKNNGLLQTIKDRFENKA
jgi:hypothetical protein